MRFVVVLISGPICLTLTGGTYAVVYRGVTLSEERVAARFGIQLVLRGFPGTLLGQLVVGCLALLARRAGLRRFLSNHCTARCVRACCIGEVRLSLRANTTANGLR